jgi:hypothetical protein
MCSANRNQGVAFGSVYLQPPVSEPIPQVFDRWVTTDFWNHGVVCYPTMTSHWLEVGEGKIRLKFRFDHE